MPKNINALIAAALLAGAGGAHALHAGEGLPVLTNNWIAVSAQGSVGLLNGTAQENVYVPLNGGRYHLSELDWDLRNVVLAGAEVSVAVNKSVWFNLGLWGAATKGSGQMNDWDWLLQQPGSPWTDWSRSEVDVTRGWILDLNGSVELTRFGGLGFRGIAGFKYNQWKWEDHGLQHIYSSNPAVPGGFRNDVANDAPVTGVIYEQDFYIPYLGAGLNYLTGRWTLDAYVLYSPFVVARDYDQHLLRNLSFEETFTGGQFIGLGVRANCDLTRRLYLTAALDAQIIPEFYGDSTVTDQTTGQTATSTGTAGLNNQSWMLSLGAGYKF